MILPPFSRPRLASRSCLSGDYLPLSLRTGCAPLDAILAAPDTTPVPTDPGACYATGCILADALRAPEHRDARRAPLITYALRLPLEHQVSVVLDMQRVDKAVANSPAAQTWLRANPDIILGGSK